MLVRRLYWARDNRPDDMHVEDSSVCIVHSVCNESDVDIDVPQKDKLLELTL